MKKKFIGVFGMMGSGKSVLINEFLFQNRDGNFVEFTPPPVEAKFRGMDFEFVDQIFALEREKVQYNFYELDAPTINKWTQFIGIADAIIIAYNFKKEDYFESPQKFIQNIDTYAKPNTPLFFVVNNCDSIEQAKSKLEELFGISKISDKPVNIRNIPPAEMEYTKPYGRRVYIEFDRLEALYDDVIAELNDK